MMQRFLGCWRLISFHMMTGTEMSYPLGEKVAGYIMYSPEGYVSVAFMAADRALFASADLRLGSADEKVSAFNTYFSYAGKFEVNPEEQTIRHRIDVSLFPNWIGAVQERFFDLKENRLVLSTTPLLVEGKEQIGYLVWERV